MAQPDKRNQTQPTLGRQSRLSRREFLANVTLGGGLFLGLGGLATRLVQFLYPSVKPLDEREVLVAADESLPPNRAQTFDIFGNRVIVVKTADGVRAFSGRCTHLGCDIQWDTTRNQFVCPCHQGIFDASGKVVSGPPPRAMDEFRAAVKNNSIYVTLPVSS